MDIFSYYNLEEAIKNQMKAGGNFAYIAQNIATIYYVIKQSNFGKSLTNAQLLFATALCDTIYYIQSGDISVEEIAMYAKIAATPSTLMRRNKYLKDLAVYIEALIFSIEVPEFEYDEIIDEIIKDTTQIDIMIDKTIEEGEKSYLYHTVYENVNIWINEDAFRDIVLSYDEIDKYLSQL